MRLLLLCALVAVVVLCEAPAAAMASPDGELDAALKALVGARNGPPGAIAVVQRGDESQVHRAGVEDPRTRTRITARDHMRLASTSKMFNGAVALGLVNAGVLGLDDTIGQRLPNLPVDPSWQSVTLRQLLQHTSGLPNFTSTPGWQRWLRSTKVPRTNLEIIDLVADQPVVFEPGTSYAYSNTDNVVVALMCEAATGQAWSNLLDERVLGPLRLTGTSEATTVAMPRPFLHGYVPDPPRPPVDFSQAFNPTTVGPAGDLVSTPQDLNRFVRAYAGAGPLFGDAVREQQRQFVAGNSEPRGPGTNAAGLAVFRYTTRCGTVYGHTGNIFGYTQFAATSVDGTRSATVSAATLIVESSAQPIARRLYPYLHRAMETAVCAALAD